MFHLMTKPNNSSALLIIETLKAIFLLYIDLRINNYEDEYHLVNSTSLASLF